MKSAMLLGSAGEKRAYSPPAEQNRTVSSARILASANLKSETEVTPKLGSPRGSAKEVVRSAKHESSYIMLYTHGSDSFQMVQ